MGFSDTLSGHIVLNDSKEIENIILRLPPLAEDEWPYLPREIFCATPENLLAYKQNFVLHFGMSVKNFHDSLSEWIEKFEKFLFSIHSAQSALVCVSITVFSSSDFDGNFYFSWKKSSKNDLWNRKSSFENPKL